MVLIASFALGFLLPGVNLVAAYAAMSFITGEYEVKSDGV